MGYIPIGRSNGTIGNIVRAKKDPEPYIFCCKCPNCKAIFTIELDKEPRWWGSYRTPCPECYICYNWIRQGITKTEFKFRRWWRQRRTLFEIIRTFTRKD